jgi:hypothetical protein
LNRDTVASLAGVLFKSYFRASRPGRKSFFSNPSVVLVIDVIIFAAPFALIWNVFPQIPPDILGFLRPLVAQAIIGLPVILTSSVILVGILFELGTAGGVASSEAVNWLPVSPREYVLASSLSVDFAYSLLYSGGLGVMIPLALRLGMAQVVAPLVILSTLSFFWGAVIVEAIRSVVNRLSSSVYRRSGRLGIILRLVLVIFFFVVMELAFQPSVLLYALSGIVYGVSLVWFIPMVWPSVALIAQLSSDATRTYIFLALSAAFSLLLFELSARLRSKYWSPVPVTINVTASTVYVPQGKSLLWLDPLGSAIASKDLRSLSRRKEMARFLAIPFIMVVVMILPFVTSGGDLHSIGFGVPLYLISLICTLLPIMLSSISIGQEGKSVVNYYMLPVSPGELVSGKLLMPLILTAGAGLALIAVMELLTSIPAQFFAVILVALAFLALVECHIGLGVGLRYPDFSIGPRARYVTMIGFILSFLLGGLSTVAVMSPFLLYFLTPIFSHLGLGPWGLAAVMIIMTAAIGSVLVVLARHFCMTGARQFLSDMVG